MNIPRKFSPGLPALVIGLALAVAGCAEGEKEITLKFADCPVAVQKTIMEHAGGVSFPEVDKETKKDGRVVFEAKGKKPDGTKIKIKVAGDGKLVGFKSEVDD